jgi:hypothetical protein
MALFEVIAIVGKRLLEYFDKLTVAKRELAKRFL